MTFEITNIENERCIDGKTTIIAIAQDENNTEVSLTYSRTEYIDLSIQSIGVLLNRKYEKMLRQKLKAHIQIGTIVGGE